MRQGVIHRVAPLAVLILGCGSGASASRSTPGLSASPAGAAPLEIAVARTGTGNPPQVDIVWMDSNGRHRRVLVGSSGNRRIHVVAGQMAWSPDGRRLAFAAEVGRSIKPVARLLVDIFVVRADGSGLRRLTHTGSAREPIWSPDRRTIVFSRATFFSHDPNPFTAVAASLWRIDTAGTRARALTPLVRGQIDVPGSFSPDGTRLAFTRFKPGTLGPGLRSENGEIDLLRPDGSNLQTLTTDGTDPAFAPDGHTIAFVSDRDRNGTVATGEDESAFANELYLMDADGRNPRRLTYTSELSERAPSWSPDGTRISYARQGSGFTRVVAVINADGSCSRTIAADPKENIWYSDPAWRPGKVGSGGVPARCGD